MNMIYVALLCYANGNCIMANGDPVYTYFNTLAACERQVQVENQGHLRNANMKAVCFEKPGWQPARRSNLEDQSGPNNAEAARLLNENEYRKQLELERQ